MSQRERDVLKVMSPVLEGKRTQIQAAELLGLSIRQVRRIQRRLEKQGEGSLAHGLRGRPSNRRLDDCIKQQVLEIYRQHYSDFGPTLACEKLSEAHQLCVGVETLRQWLLDAGLWSGKRRRDKHRRRRERKECFGQMVQADASEHDWLEGRGERMRLLGIIDDANSRVMLRFYPTETTQAYMDLLERWIKKHGRPLSWYSDRHSVFVGSNQEGEPVATQFSRALAELGIELICASTPQAKGRVERLWGTAQDRLVKELRLAGAVSIEQANAVLEERFVPWFNRHCVVKPASSNDAHLPLGKQHDLSAIFSIQEVRVVSSDYTIRCGNVLYQLLPPAWPGLRKGKVVVEKRPDGSMKIRFGKRYLEYEVAARQVCEPGALPPDPRSLAPEPIPAAGAQGEGREEGESSRPAAVHRAGGRSGRTPAEPCLSAGESCGRAKDAWRPAPNHPWRNGR